MPVYEYDSLRGRRKPWREKVISSLKHTDGQELRIGLLWFWRGSKPEIELRQWDVRFEPAKPTSFGLRIDAAYIPEILEAIEKVALESGELANKHAKEEN